MSDKYITFKRQDWEEFLTGPAEADTPNPVEDAVVIRRQDLFAAPAFDTYANSIQVGIEINGGAVSSEVVDRLQDIADYFHEQSRLSWLTDRKLPD